MVSSQVMMGQTIFFINPD